MAEHFQNPLERELGNLARECLQENFQLYNLHVHYSPKGMRIVVILDKLSDPYGSPNISDCSEFSRRFSLLLKSRRPQGLPEDYTLEVSSPGAERELRTPQEWKRFKNLPMKIFFKDKEQKKKSAIVYYVGSEGDSSRFRYFFPEKQKKKTKQNLSEEEFIISHQDILRIQLYVAI